MAAEPLIDPEQHPRFGVHASHYLARAESRLKENTSESLYYAALELRCGVEARMRQYLAAQKAISKKKAKGYQIAKLAKGIEAIFKTGEKYVRFTVEDPQGQVLVELWYTPVSAPLRKYAEWCGGLLHAQQVFRPPGDPWWGTVMNRLQDMSKLLSLAIKGELIGVPLVNPDGQLDLSIEYLDERALHEKLKVGAHHVFRARYLASPPSEWLDAETLVAADR